MPVIPPVGPQVPYDPLEYVLKVLRVILNDMNVSAAGVLLTDNKPVVLPLINMAYRTLQEDLTSNGVETFAKEAILAGMAAVPQSVTDPAIQPYIGYDGFFDGLNIDASPVLPQDMIGPLRLWERRSGINGRWCEMNRANDGLPSGPRGSQLRVWDNREDGRIYFVGSNQVNDIRLRYNEYLPELITVNDPVRILRCDRALAYKAAEIFTEPRSGDSEKSSVFASKYQYYLDRMCERTARRKQRGNHRRRPYSWGAHGGWG
ncbi:MAG TPA: hypothetical protein VGK24_05800 [Candidatus Angelobacter sp.]|jgi:hypothetical protein